MQSLNERLSAQEADVLADAEAHGELSAVMFRDGVFSEVGFVRYGVMQRLAIRGHLAFLGHTGGQQNAAYHYALVEQDRRAA
jgi:hypothetical protein